ncbi:hypothetical protein [Bailinhaonella thermotolerans]|uniref:EfeO-type cupredoxin-like domain-containing protein n=1 Tax=Bailinhaonella thermotolerans TaxID=1070861 RepID=A0A3A4A9Q6_9ACTN|nr:hypothetical protein [Bailinhaonella thermotolerans]RJL24769.1 hypothetical protein D5H75_28710 [Bailinhaonella thermotolerans]
MALRVLIAGVLLVVLGACGTGRPAAETPAAPGDVERVEVSYAGGRVTPPSRRVKVGAGATVEIRVTSDRADEFHLHGYDRSMRLEVGEPGTIRLVADVPGVFEAELHDAGVQLFQLQVG